LIADSKGIDCPCGVNNLKTCLPITVPPNDVWLGNKNRITLNFTRKYISSFFIFYFRNSKKIT
jgi:hypothetical protein